MIGHGNWQNKTMTLSCTNILYSRRSHVPRFGFWNRMLHVPPWFEPKRSPQNQKSLLSLAVRIEAAMEAILTDCVQNSLRHFMHRNAIFICERLCAEFPSEVPVLSFFLFGIFHSLFNRAKNKNKNKTFYLKS
jgi:hypothetical protein